MHSFISSHARVEVVDEEEVRPPVLVAVGHHQVVVRARNRALHHEGQDVHDEQSYKPKSRDQTVPAVEVGQTEVEAH